MISGDRLVFDVGGTNLRAAMWSGPRRELSEALSTDAPSHARHADLAWNALRDRLVAEMSALRSRLDPAGRVASVAIAFPGPVDPEGRVLAAPTLWGALGRYPYSLNRDLEAAWPGTRVRILNDVSAAGHRYVQDDGDTLCVVTVSTGIGNKVFVGGRPVAGPSGLGGEIGHLRVDDSPTARSCDCGGRGHLGAIASGRGLASHARDDAEGSPEGFRRSLLSSAMRLEASLVTAEALAVAYAAGDAWATRHVLRAADALGAAFAAIHMAVGVERFVLIGGLAVGLGSPFADAVREAASSRCWSSGSPSLRVALGATDGHCALIGAGRAPLD